MKQPTFLKQLVSQVLPDTWPRSRELDSEQARWRVNAIIGLMVWMADMD